MKKFFAIIGTCLVLMISVVPFAVSAYDADDFSSVYSVVPDTSSIPDQGNYYVFPYDGSSWQYWVITFVDGHDPQTITGSIKSGSGTTPGWFNVSGSTSIFGVHHYGHGLQTDLSSDVDDIVSIALYSDYQYKNVIDVRDVIPIHSREYLDVVSGLDPDGDPYPPPPAPPADPSPAECVTEVFSSVGDWIVSSLGSLSEAFWVNGSLTLLGTLAVCGLGIAVCLLVISLICKWLKFGG